jgi:hypothetical protein
VVARAPSSAGVIFSVNNPGGQQPGSSPNYNEVSQAPNGDIVAKFIASGTLNILDTACGVSADYMIIAGGGSGANGGGGAGGYRSSGYGPSPLRGSAVTLGVGTYSVTVGAGATGEPNLSTAGPNGNPSSFYGIESTGGGGGAFASTAGGSGGSGGGQAGSSYGSGAKGSGNTPPVDPPQGNPGGDKGPNGPGSAAGGGAGGTGGASSGSAGGPGGAGVPNAITGSCTQYASGGSGGGDSGGPQAATPGGGGQGGTGSSAGGNGTANTGGGGGGTRDELGTTAGSNGGSGIVVVRVPGSTCAAVAPGTNSIATLPAPDGGCKVASFTVSGTLTIS